MMCVNDDGEGDGDDVCGEDDNDGTAHALGD